jgi:prepilin-type N-terminal cleavage/methylation domain-containing protein
MRRPQSGMTLLEVMIASAILATMMMLTWGTISNTSKVHGTFASFEERNHELRMAMQRIVSDFESAYLSKNEDQAASHPRTMFIAKATGKLPEIRFSTLGHRVLWADANESEQTVVSYLGHLDPETKTYDWVRREQRRPSNNPPEDEPSEYDILVRDITSAKLELWNWKNQEWQDTWDTTQSDGQKGWLPSRVRITVVVKDPFTGKDYKVSTQARILLQEPLNFVQ